MSHLLEEIMRDELVDDFLSEVLGIFAPMRNRIVVVRRYKLTSYQEHKCIIHLSR